MNISVRIEYNNIKWLGYTIIFISVAVLILLLSCISSFGSAADTNTLVFNLSEAGIALGLYVSAFATNQAESAPANEATNKATKTSLVFAVCLLIVLAFMSAVYPQRLIINSSNLSLIAIITLLIYNVRLRDFRI